MITYQMENRENKTIYEYLYENIKRDILKGRLEAGEKLPSKRSFAKQLGISTISVENTYNQLLAEGYIYSVERSGYYVSELEGSYVPQNNEERPQQTAEERWQNREQEKKAQIDFTGSAARKENFPFSIWSRLMRSTMSKYQDKLMTKSPSEGIYELRCAIAGYLMQFRGLAVRPEQIIVGAGTEYLYGLIIKLLGRDKLYAVEEPGYRKIARVYEANEVRVSYIPLDDHGIDVRKLKEAAADVVHISPSHHFPTGIITPITRRLHLLEWANEAPERYIIEDDYDSEFRMVGKPLPTLSGIDENGRVIYINTFSKSLSQTIRISYMVLPERLLERYRETFDFYSCTVSTFEQYTLAHFISDGYFEKHINRMRNQYRNTRDCLLCALRNEPGLGGEIMEEHAGLHFLLRVDTELSDEELIKRAAKIGLAISCLSQYYHDKAIAPEHIILINYAGISTAGIEAAVRKLAEIRMD